MFMPKRFTEILQVQLMLGLIRLLCFATRFFGLKSVSTLGAAIGWVVGKFRPRELAIVDAQIRAVARTLDTTETLSSFFSQSNQSSRTVFSCVGRAFAESLVIAEIIPKIDSYVESSEQEEVTKVIKQGRGAICLSGHIGCFELLAAYHISKGVPLSVVARYPNDAWMGDVVQRIRDQYGLETIWREDSGSARKIVADLKKGRFVAALIDQDTKLDNVYIPFLGIQAAYPATLVRLAARQNSHIFASFIIRIAADRHRIVTETIDYDPNSDTLEYDVIAEYGRIFDRLVLAYPEQWIWWHRRWRRRPEVNYDEHPELLRGTSAYIEWLNSLP
jgi:KDO2-lipid IV(A) lauroyltransferase